MEKRGAGHVEIVISYLLFVSFIIFIFYFFNPIKTSKLTESSLPLVFEEISRNITLIMKTYSVSIEDTSLESISIDLGEDLTGKTVRVENYTNSSQAFAFSPNPPTGSEVRIYPEGESFILIRVSEEIQEQEAGGLSKVNQGMGNLMGLPAPPPPGEEYTIAYVGTREVYSEKKAEALIGEYYSNYQGLKGDLNIRNNDFAFNLTFGDSSLGAARFIPVGIEVYSDYKRREVIREDGSLAFADLNVRVW